MATTGLKGFPGLEQLDAVGFGSLLAGLVMMAASLMAAGLLYLIMLQVGDSTFYVSHSAVAFLTVFGIAPGFGWFAIYWLCRAVELDVRQVTDGDSRLEGLEHLLAIDRRHLAVTALLGAIVSSLCVNAVESKVEGQTFFEALSIVHATPEGLLAFYIVVPLLGIPGGLTLAVYAAQIRCLIVLAQTVDINLFDTSRLTYISQPPLRFLMVWGVSQCALFFMPLLAPGTEDAFSLISLSIGCLAALIVGLYMFPVYLLRNRVFEEKQRELEVISRALSGDLSLVSTSILARSGATLSPGDWLTHQMFVESRWDWPIGPHVQKVTLFVLLPPVSWILAATIENILY